MRVGLEVDVGDSDQLAVERHGEVLVEGLAGAAEVVAAPRDDRGHALKRRFALGGEPECDVGFTAVGVGARLGVGDLAAPQRDVVLEHEELRARTLSLNATGGAELGGDRLEHDRSPRHGQDLALGRAHARRESRKQIRPVVGWPGQQAVLTAVGTVPFAFAAAWQAAVPGAPNMKYCWPTRELAGFAFSGCSEASSTAW